MKKQIISVFLALGSFLLFVTPSFAHVIVTPKQVGIGTVQEFSMSVPTEKDNPTIGIKLIIPSWIHGEVVPNAKPGWTINIVKKDDQVTEIDWTGGTIPPGQRDDFLFQAQVPSSEVTLKWKAIQMYQDGSTVEWIHDPSKNPDDDSAPPPYSTTKIVNDLTQPSQGVIKTKILSQLPIALSGFAIVLSVISLGLVLLRKNS